MFRSPIARLASVLSAAALTLIPSLLHAQKALVYCPVGIDATGCNTVIAALAADPARFPGGADAGYDGTQGTVDLASADFSTYAVFVVPSLADGAGVQPYALLRNATIAGRVKTAFMGRTAVWSGTPDVGSTNRAAKDELIRNLAAWARSDAAGTHGPGLVALEDNSDEPAARYGWLGGMSALGIAADTTFEVYSNVQVLTATGRTILTNSAGLQIGYTNMASFGLVRAGGSAGATDEATGGRSTRVVLVTAAGDPSDPNIATVSTDKDDYVPGDTVTVTGTGWEIGETVSLLFHEDVDPPNHPDRTLSALADSLGHIFNRQYAIDSTDIGVRFTLTATGLTSGKVAQATFTDLPRIATTVTVGAQSGSPVYGTASSATFVVTPTRSANGTVNGTFSVTSALPSGVTASFSLTSFTANGGNAFPSSTLTLSIGASAQPGSYAFTVRVADGSDQGNGGGTLVIAPKTITGSITAANKVYDATTAATISTRTLTGVVGADVVSLTGGTATFANKNVGAGKVVTATGLSLTGTNAGKYTLASTSATTTASITAATLTGGFTAANKTYDGTTAAAIVSRTPVGVLGGDIVTLNGGTATFASKEVGTGKTVTASGFTLGGADAGNYVLGAIGTTTADITGQLVTASFTAASKVYDGTTAAVILTRSITGGVVGGDDVTLTGGTATFADKNAGPGKTVTGTGFTLGGADAGNYQLGTVATATANITVASVTGSVTAQNKSYDGTTAATILTRSLAGAVAGDDVTLAGGTATFADKNVGTGKAVTATGLGLAGTDAPNYQLTSTSAATTADITPMAITVTAATDSKAYDGTTASSAIPTVTTGTLLSGDVGSFTQTFDTKNAGTGKTLTPVGSVSDGNGGNNYALTFAVNTTGAITAQVATPAIVADDKVYDGTTAATLSSQTVSGVIAPDVVTVVVGSATFADKNAGVNKTVTAAGLTLGGADAGNYALSATTATAQASITPRPLTVTATGIDKPYDGTKAATVTLAADRVSGDALTTGFASASFGDKNVGNGKAVSVTGISLGGADAGNYTFNTTTTTTANITARALAVTASGIDKVYDATTAASVTLSDDRLADDDVIPAYASAAFADKNVGTGKPVSVGGISVGGPDAGNYVANATASAVADITPATLAVTATGVDKAYDGTTTATVTLSASALLSDVVTPAYASAGFADQNVGSGKTVTVGGITLGGADAGNYLANSSTTTTADITPLGLIGTITASSKAYDATVAATIATRTLAGVLAGDVVTYTGGTAAFADKNVGTGKTVTATGLSLGGADAGNYSVNTSATATADITPLGVAGAITAGNRVYDATTTATILTRTLTGVLGSDVVSYVGGSASFTTKDVGIAKPVNATGLSLAGADAGNYTVNATAATTADITAASSATVVLSTPASLPYSDLGQSLPLAATVTSPTVPGVTEGVVVFTIKNALNVTVGSATAPVNVLGGSASATYAVPGITDVGMYTIQAAFTGANFGTGSIGNGTLTVQPASFVTTTATTDADFKSADDLDVLFKQDGKLSTLKLQNTNPGTVHYQLTYNNVTGVDIDAANGASLKSVVEIPSMNSCGGVACAPGTYGASSGPAWVLKGAKAVHVKPDDKTDDMPVQFSYKAGGDCSLTSGYGTLTSLAGAPPKCIMVTGFAIPKKHRARIDLHLEFRWKDSGGWLASPDPKLYFFSGFAFKSTSTANFPSVVPSVRQSYESAGLVAAGQRVTAAGGFIFDAASSPVAGYKVRLFNTAAEVAAPNACTSASPVAEATSMLDGFWFIWKAGSNQTLTTAPALPSKVQYSMVVCDPSNVSVATRTMSDRMKDKEFDQEDFRLTTLVATGP